MNLKLFAKNNKVLVDDTEASVNVKSLDERIAAKGGGNSKTPSVSGSEGSTTPIDIENLSGRPSDSRRVRVRSLGQRSSDAASTDRMKRNTDSMLEDAVISGYLKTR